MIRPGGTFICSVVDDDFISYRNKRVRVEIVIAMHLHAKVNSAKNVRIQFGACFTTNAFAVIAMTELSIVPFVESRCAPIVICLTFAMITMHFTVNNAKQSSIVSIANRYITKYVKPM